MSNFIHYNHMKFPHQQYKLMDKIPYSLVQPIREHGILIAGGSITSVFTNSPIKDLDLYPTSQDSYDKFHETLRKLVDESTNENDKLLFVSDNAVTYRYAGVVIQIIHKFLQILGGSSNSVFTPEEVLETFDFTCCMGCYDLKSHEFILHKDFLIDNVSRSLVYNSENPRYPICAMYRVLKYQKKGYTISAGELVKLSLCICNLKMESYQDLKDQLLGIDTQIFMEITEDLIEKHGKDAKIDYGVVMNIINEKLNSLWESEQYLELEESGEDENWWDDV